MRRRKRLDDSLEINVTPLLDVVFILLIFFIVTTSFVREIGVDADRPAGGQGLEREVSDVIAIRIDASGQVFVNERAVDIRSVKANVASGLAGKAETPVVVVADRRADAGLMVRAMDQARAAGATRISVATLAR
jgi:biopolymer transport protein ExbD